MVLSTLKNKLLRLSIEAVKNRCARGHGQTTGGMLTDPGQDRAAHVEIWVGK